MSFRIITLAINARALLAITLNLSIAIIATMELCQLFFFFTGCANPHTKSSLLFGMQQVINKMIFNSSDA